MSLDARPPWETDPLTEDDLRTTDSIPSGGLAESAKNAGAEVTVVTPEVKLAPDTAVIKIDPSSDAVFIALHGEGVKLLDLANAREITGTLSAQNATDDLTIIANFTKEMKAKAKEYTDPINHHLKTVKFSLDKLLEPFVEANDVNRRKVIAFNSEQERKQAEIERANWHKMEAARIEAEASGTGEITESVILTPVPFVAKNTKGELGTAGQTKTLKIEVEDKSKVPMEYLEVDLVKARKVIAAGVEIPGIKSWYEAGLRISTR